MRSRLSAVYPVRQEHVTRFAVTVITLHLFFRAWAVSGTWFDTELIIFMNALALGESSISWVFERYSVHFLPLNKLQALLIASTGEPLNWGFTFAYIMVLTLILALVAWWMLVVVFGNRPGILIPLGFFLFGSMSWPSTLFLVGTLNYFPALICAFAMVGLWVKYLRANKKRYLPLVAMFYAIGLMAYSNVLIFSVVLALLMVFYFASGSLKIRFIYVLRNFWHGLLMLGTISIVYLYILLVVDRDVIPPTNAERSFYIIDYMIGVHSTPFLFGGPLRWNEDMSGHIEAWYSLSLISTVILTLVVLYRHKTHSNSLPPVIIYFVSIAFTSFMIAGSRSDMWAELAANEPRYWVMLSAVGTLCIGLFIMPITDSPNPLSKRADALYLFKIQSSASPIFIGVFLTASAYSSITLTNHWNENTAQPFKKYVTTATDDLMSESVKVELARGYVPEKVMWGMLFPENGYSRFFAQYREYFDEVSSGNDLKTFDDSGTLRSAVVFNEPTHAPGPAPGCGYFIQNEPVSIALVPNPWGSFWLSFGYLSAADSTVIIDVAGKTQVFELEKGLHTGFIELNKEVDEITFTPTSSTQLCIDVVRVGPLSPGR